MVVFSGHINMSENNFRQKAGKLPVDNTDSMGKI
jgi:hypothetical protein